MWMHRKKFKLMKAFLIYSVHVISRIKIKVGVKHVKYRIEVLFQYKTEILVEDTCVTDTMLGVWMCLLYVSCNVSGVYVLFRSDS